MTREQIHVAIDSLNAQELARVVAVITALQADRGYLAVRRALAGLTVSLSEDIIRVEREDRV